MNEVSNINSIALSGLKRMYISRKNADHVVFLKHRAADVCRGDVSATYIKKAMKVFENGLLYMRGNTIAGLCIWRVIGESISKGDAHIPKCMYMYLYCTMENHEKLGTKIMNDIHNYCIRENIYRIELEPTETSVGFYEKMGFLHIVGSARPTMYTTIRVHEIGKRTVTRKTKKRQIDAMGLYAGDALEEILL